MTALQPLADALRAHAARGDDAFSVDARRLAARIDGALADDRQVHLDEYQQIVNETAALRARTPGAHPASNFLRNVEAGMSAALGSRGHWFWKHDVFTPFVPLVTGAGEVQLTPAAEPVRVGGKRHYATQISPALARRVLGERYTLPEDLREGERLHASAQVRDARGREMPFRAIYGEVKKRLFLEGSLGVRIDGVEFAVRKHDVVSLALGRGRIPSREFELPLPQAGTQKLHGVRLAFVVAEPLVDAGLIPAEELATWIATDDAAAAAKAVLPKLDGLHLESLLGSDGHFTADGETSLEYALTHGVLCFSHRARGPFHGLHEQLPDVLTPLGPASAEVADAIRTPSGPLMLAFDRPLESTGSHHARWPAENAYVRSVSELKLRLNAPLSDARPDDPAAQPEIPSIERLAELRREFRAYADRQRAGDPAPLRGLARILDALEAPVRHQRRALAAAAATSLRANHEQPRLRRFLLDTPQANAAETEERALRRWLEHASAIVAGTRMLLMTHPEAGVDPGSSATLATQLDDAARLNPSVAAEVQRLVWVQEDVRRATLNARLRSASSARAIADYDDAEVSVFEKHRALDWLFSFGSSTDGWLHRASKQAQGELDASVSEWGDLFARGESNVRAALDGLLTHEAGQGDARGRQYVADRNGLAEVKPAFERLVDMLDRTSAADYALSQAEHYITMRNMTPMTVTETTTDSKGHTRTTTRPNPTYAMYAAQAASWSSTAVERVRDIKDAVRPLQQALEDGAFRSHVSDDLGDSISWFFGMWLNIGFWSYDSSQVDELQRQLGRFEAQLRVVNDEVAPVHHRYRRGVETALRTRREELLA